MNNVCPALTVKFNLILSLYSSTYKKCFTLVHVIGPQAYLYLVKDPFKGIAGDSVTLPAGLSVSVWLLVQSNLGLDPLQKTWIGPGIVYKWLQVVEYCYDPLRLSLDCPKDFFKYKVWCWIHQTPPWQLIDWVPCSWWVGLGTLYNCILLWYGANFLFLGLTSWVLN